MIMRTKHIEFNVSLLRRYFFFFFTDLKYKGIQNCRLEPNNKYTLRINSSPKAKQK